jgi:hypothetical protein
MALVEVGRFLDLSEAQAAASALRASGMHVLMQNENWGQIETHMQLAVGGFPLLTAEEDADDARAFLAEVRGPAVTTESYRMVTLAAVVAATLTGPLGWWLAPLLRRRRALPDDA